MPVHNEDIAAVFEEIADLLEIEGDNPFRIRAYRNGARMLLSMAQAQARIKLVALPERAATIIRLDNPAATLIEEERVLTLQKGLNKVDFSWKAVSINGCDSVVTPKTIAALRIRPLL